MVSFWKTSSPIISLLHVCLSVFLVAAVLWYFQNLAVLLFLSFILSSALYPLVEMGKKAKIPAPLTILTLYILIFSVLSFLISLIVPPLYQQTTQLLQIVSQMLNKTAFAVDLSALRDVSKLVQNFSLDQYGNILNQFTGSVKTVFTAVTSTFSVFFVIITFMIVSFHMLLNMKSLALSFAWMLPGDSKKEKADLALKLLESITMQLGSWVRGQLVLMFTIGLATYLGLLLLGVPYALPLAIFAGLLEVIPNLGPTIAAIPGVMVAFLVVNPAVGLLTLAFYILVQQVENSMLVPLVMREAVDVRSLTTIVLMLIGFQTLGIAGAILVVPLYITIRTLVRTLSPDNGPFSDYSKYL